MKRTTRGWLVMTYTDDEHGDVIHDSGEGPFDTAEQAREFAKAEVGVAWCLLEVPAKALQPVQKKTAQKKAKKATRAAPICAHCTKPISGEAILHHSPGKPSKHYHPHHAHHHKRSGSSRSSGSKTTYAIEPRDDLGAMEARFAREGLDRIDVSLWLDAHEDVGTFRIIDERTRREVPVSFFEEQ